MNVRSFDENVEVRHWYQPYSLHLVVGFYIRVHHPIMAMSVFIYLNIYE
jgi:hypothetical protein